MNFIKQKHKGLFIVLEGVDGSGKTTQLNYIKYILTPIAKEKGINIVTVHEPGGTVIGEKIRKLLLDKNDNNISAEAELLLFEAARAQIIHDVIKPALDNGDIVICDRFTDSTCAYQGAGRGIDFNAIDTLNNFATAGITPDLKIILSLSESEKISGIDRKKSQTDHELDKFESLDVSFHNMVHDYYDNLRNSDEETYTVKINATNKPIVVGYEIFKAIDTIVHNIEYNEQLGIMTKKEFDKRRTSMIEMAHLAICSSVTITYNECKRLNLVN